MNTFYYFMLYVPLFFVHVFLPICLMSKRGEWYSILYIGDNSPNVHTFRRGEKKPTTQGESNREVICLPIIVIHQKREDLQC